MEGQIGAVKNSLVGVYAANDGTAGGAIAALKGGIQGSLPPVTGQDSELAAIQRILVGDQAMTIYKPIKPEAAAAAGAALSLANGKTPAKTADFKGIAATILDPVAVTKDNVKDTVIKDGIYKTSDICTGDVAAACTAAGIS
jgi:D-xylose transport system substrate-binding protein